MTAFSVRLLPPGQLLSALVLLQERRELTPGSSGNNERQHISVAAHIS